MEKVIDLKDLLKHEITDLYSAEEQIIEALPLMIEKAGNDKLKSALKDHLKVTEDQKSRLDEIKQLLGEPSEDDTGENKQPGFFSRLFGGGEEEKCKAMEGLIAEGKKMMSADMSPEAADAAIIASAQKIEHYEISGYGTARAFARELNLGEVANKLGQTLNEEYAADDLLTQLAVGKVNIDAEFATDPDMEDIQPKAARKPNSNAKISKSASTAKSAAKKVPAKKTAGKSSPSKSSSSKSAAAKKSSAKLSPSNARKGNKGSALKTAAKKTAAKKSAAKAAKKSSKSSPSKSKSSGRR